MKITETKILLFKLTCFLSVPLLTPFVGLMKPRAEAGEWPNSVQWTVTLFVAVIGMFNAGLAFSSGSFAKWREDRKVPPSDGPTPTP